MAAIVAFVVGVLPNIPGFLNAAFPAAVPSMPEFFKTVYTYAWFVGVVLSAVVYLGLMKARAPQLQGVAAPLKNPS
jgi:NCS1 family nucleobase:cation symporter-1